MKTLDFESLSAKVPVPSKHVYKAKFSVTIQYLHLATTVYFYTEFRIPASWQNICCELVKIVIAKEPRRLRQSQSQNPRDCRGRRGSLAVTK